MRWLLALAAIAAPLAAADLSSIGPVYFWPMNGALDQYVAGQVTSEGLFPVTVDPARAKTVMTDHIDAKFFEGMSEVFAPPAVEENAEAWSSLRDLGVFGITVDEEQGGSGLGKTDIHSLG